MREVKVARTELLTKVKTNRKKHIDEFTDAVAGYKQAALRAIDDAVKKLKRSVEELQAGQRLQLQAVSFNLVVPENHAADYDQVITMLEMSVDDQLIIRSDEFACYVMDNWSWRNNFESTKALYSSLKN